MVDSPGAPSRDPFDELVAQANDRIVAKQNERVIIAFKLATEELAASRKTRVDTSGWSGHEINLFEHQMKRVEGIKRTERTHTARCGMHDHACDCGQAVWVYEMKS